MSGAEQRKKLIEVALPIDEINAACKADKGRAHGTIKNLHKWFAPMPLPAWRGLLFAALVDDPSDDEKRAHLLDVIKRLVANGADVPDSGTVDEARKIISEQFPDGVPTVMDPFCGGGSTLLEAQRLGLTTYGSDLNPVPVLVARALTELLPRVYGRQPIHGLPSTSRGRSAGLAETDDAVGAADEFALVPTKTGGKIYAGFDGLIGDIMHYAKDIRDEAWNRLKDHYPHVPGETLVAWLWARTAICPNPACGIETILTTSWWLSKKEGELAWIEPRVEAGAVHLDVITQRHDGEAPPSPKSPRGATFQCLGCSNAIGEDVLDGQAGTVGLGLRLTAVVIEQAGRRMYRAASRADEDAAAGVELGDADVPDTVPAADGGSRNRFGLNTQADLYTPRQLLSLSTIAGLIADTPRRVLQDGGSREWADAITTMLGLGVGRLAQFASSQARWTVRDTVSSFEGAFPRNDLPMTWDFYEINIFGDTGPSWLQTFVSSTRALKNVVPDGRGRVVLSDARLTAAPQASLVATDPPYFDAIGYADLSDYFYVWHRRALRDVYPDLYATIAAPKSGELTAMPGHHGNSRVAARSYFIEGFTQTFKNLQDSLAPGLPMIVVYASREQKGGVEEETRWSSILTAMVQADLQITGTWPILGTTDRRMIGQGTNAVATYVAMVCRPRPATAGTSSLGDFNRALRRELKPAVHNFQGAGILPLDLAQAAMGPGMQVYSRYREVLDQSGKRVSVDRALRLINAALGEVLDEQEGELDPYSRFAVAWWDRHGWDPAAFGEADKLARPQGISVDDLVRAGVVRYPKPGFVSVLGSGALDRTWKPSADSHPTAWEAVHHLADRLISGGGALEAGRLMGELGTLRDPAQALVYRLHAIGARKGATKDQERYNALIGSWSDLLAISSTEKDGLF